MCTHHAGRQYASVIYTISIVYLPVDLRRPNVRARRYLHTLVFGWGLVLSGQGHAASEDVDLFRDMAFQGCMAAMATGGSIDFYAQTKQLQTANSYLAAAFLRGRAGNAYIKATPATVVIIAQAGATYCTVATRIASDMPALRQAVENDLTTSQTPFKMVDEKSRSLGNGVTSITREYDGRVGNRPLGVMFSSAENGPAPQAVLTVFPKAK
jgi:hypothetical protein